MRFIIVTGMSGAGKSTALKILEDAGYFCVDNLPIPLMDKFAQFVIENGAKGVERIALGVDIRSGEVLKKLGAVLEHFEVTNLNYEILFLDADDDVLIKRYKETRRNHPLARNGRVDAGIRAERSRLEFLKKQADYIIDTSHLLTRELKTALEKIFVKNQKFKNLMITILSFGFKHGIPEDADLVFDVRFLPNPYYIDELKTQTGNDAPVRDYVLGFDVTTQFMEKLTDMVRFLIPNYVQEGKHQLVIAVGCTGGKHRSVTLANELYYRLINEEEYGLRIEHRDIGKF